jgi:type VI secretion system protein ImpH
MALLSATAPRAARGLEDSLFAEGHAYQFFQAVRLLERLNPAGRPVGHSGPPPDEVVRFLVHASTVFPPSPIWSIERPTPLLPVPVMTVAFLGLTGPSAILPLHYTELLLRVERASNGPEKHAWRDWLDLFHHRLLSLFYRAWEKYRFVLPFERGEYSMAEPDSFTRSLFSLLGMGTPFLRQNFWVSGSPEGAGPPGERVPTGVEDLALLRYGGLLSQRSRGAAGLEALLQDYFAVSVRVQQFQGQWLRIRLADRSYLGDGPLNNALGIDAVAGGRVWNLQSKFRVRLGPLSYCQFVRLLPDRTPGPDRRAFFLLAQLVRFYVGPELDFDIQLVLRARDIPECRLSEGEAPGPRLGWNTWLVSQALDNDAGDAVFEGDQPGQLME